VRAVEVVGQALGLAPGNAKANYHAALLQRMGGRDAAASLHMQRTGLSPGLDHDYMPFDCYVAKRQSSWSSRPMRSPVNGRP